ncbi:MAG TPA: hypothetical protein VHC91_10580 [Trinickia sp.]|uniref:hypothetical protein n=1 Tax=Trinickia sp. TaxID=2571163 RepID=UPI002B68C675|nr:hypothetical protein [Trinickia sp.]HVW50823.1 hypothetical protein [Trinickia sp.]
MNDRISAATAALTGAKAAEPHIAHAHIDGLEGSIDDLLAVRERVIQRGESLLDALDLREARERVLERVKALRRLL